MKAGGRIVHIGSSMTRYAAFAGASLYTLTKGAVAGFNRSLARDLGPKGITVNTVHPGPTDFILIRYRHRHENNDVD